MKHEDICAFNPVPRPVTPAPRRKWPWLLAGLGLLLTALLVALALGLVSLFDTQPDSWLIAFDGEPWSGTSWHEGSGWGSGLGLAIGLSVGLLVLMLVIPLTVLTVAITLACVALGLALGLGGVLLGLAAVVAVVLSPLWLFVLLLWLVFKPSRRSIAA